MNSYFQHLEESFEITILHRIHYSAVLFTKYSTKIIHKCHGLFPLRMALYMWQINWGISCNAFDAWQVVSEQINSKTNVPSL